MFAFKSNWKRVHFIITFLTRIWVVGGRDEIAIWCCFLILLLYYVGDTSISRGYAGLSISNYIIIPTETALFSSRYIRRRSRKVDISICFHLYVYLCVMYTLSVRVYVCGQHAWQARVTFPFLNNSDIHYICGEGSKNEREDKKSIQATIIWL